MLYFAYGANMDRAVMATYAPSAAPLGLARLYGCRFVITGDGYASVARAAGQTVHGVLWRITPRDRVTLDRWEGTAGGLYRAAFFPIAHAGRRQPALVYVARPRGAGVPRRGYMELILAAAREWKMSRAYIASLQQWRAPRTTGLGQRADGRFGWKR